MMRACPMGLLMMVLLFVAGPAQAADCGADGRNQSRELRVSSVDAGYQLELAHLGEWRRLLTASGEIALPRLALDRAEVAFLVEVEGTWTLQILRLDGDSMELGQLSKRPAEMCYDGAEQNLLLVSASGAVTPLALPRW